jgi:hypothetical protein
MTVVVFTSNVSSFEQLLNPVSVGELLSIQTSPTEIGSEADDATLLEASK